MPNADCDAHYRCSWDSVRNFMTGRIYTPQQLEQICFSHTDYSDGADGKQWLIASIIALPMVTLTVFLMVRWNICQGKKNSQFDRSQLQE